MCCVRLDDFDWVDIADVSRDIRCLPDEFLVMLTSHLDVEMGPRADEGPDDGRMEYED